VTAPPRTVARVTPTLSTMLVTFSRDAPPSWDHLFAQARAADVAGIDRVFVSDHVVFGEDLEAYARPELGGTEGGRQPTGPDGHWLEPLTVLAMIAAVTTQVRLATGILIAALRRPVVLAKTAATIDVLSGGRLDLGVGVGWQREEYEAAGLDFGGRGRLLDHTLAVCQELWRNDVARVEDEHLRFDRIHQMPKPAQPDGVPIWVSGTLNDRVLQRIVRFGSGWIPWGPDAKDVVAGLARVHAALRDAGRTSAGFRVAGNLPVVRRDDRSIDLDATMAGVAPLVDAGVTDFRVHLPLPSDHDGAVEAFAPVVAAFRDAVGRGRP
jgi:probable F420-dependent oxidoreductase